MIVITFSVLRNAVIAPKFSRTSSARVRGVFQGREKPKVTIHLSPRFSVSSSVTAVISSSRKTSFKYFLAVAIASKAFIRRAPRYEIDVNIRAAQIASNAPLAGKLGSKERSSAACGSDLLALSEAGNLGLRRRVVLPFDRDKFRTTSVTDRPGDWGGLYEKILDEVEMRQDLLIIKAKSETEAYTQVNHVIVDNAISLGLALQQPVAAMVVWDGKSRGAEDYTEEFGIYARSRGIPVDGVMSL